MATGSGKTIVMAMLIAWQVLNKVTYPQDTRFSKNVLVVAPGLTVKNRLAVLVPDSPGNYYDEFDIVPAGLARQAAAGQGAGAQLARPELGERRADRQAEERGQARRQERRGLRPRGAGRDGGSAEHPGDQRRGPSRLARAGRVEGQGGQQGRKSKRRPSGSAVWTGSTGPAESSPATTSRRRRLRPRASRARRRPCSTGS